MDNKLPLCWPLEEFLNKKVIVTLTNNREVEGVLQGYDKVGNIVLKDCVETIPLWGINQNFTPRNLGTAVVRSSHIRALDVAPDEKV